jgi:hypothetical protein
LAGVDTGAKYSAGSNAGQECEGVAEQQRQNENLRAQFALCHLVLLHENEITVRETLNKPGL